jgi:hypothetical protein
MKAWEMSEAKVGNLNGSIHWGARCGKERVPEQEDTQQGQAGGREVGRLPSQALSLKAVMWNPRRPAASILGCVG